MNQAPFVWNQPTFLLRLEKRFFYRSFENLILISLDLGKGDDLSSQFKVWQFWIYHWSQTWHIQLLQLDIDLAHCLVLREPRHQLQNFVACHSIFILTGADTKVLFSILPKTHWLCAGVFSFFIYWKKTGLSKTQDGNKTTFDFMVRMLSDTNGSNHITDCVHFSWTRIQYCLWLCYPNLQGFSGKTFAIIVNQTSKYCYWRVNLHFPNPITMIFTCTWFFAQIIQLAPFKSENLFTLWFCLRDAFP